MSRVFDTLLAEAMGMARPTDIRSIIEANRAELETFGLVHSARAPYTSGRGRVSEATAYYLNEEQALAVVALSRTEAGRKLRFELIRVFTAWRNGKLVPALPNFGNPAEAGQAWALDGPGSQGPPRALQAAHWRASRVFRLHVAPTEGRR